MQSRSGDITIRLISLIVFSALIIYIAVAALGAILHPLETTVAANLTLDDVAEVNGYITRTETVLGGSGYAVIAKEGDRVGVGQIIAAKYSGEESAALASRISELKSLIAQLEKEQSMRKSEAERAADSIRALSKAAAMKDMSSIGISSAGVRSFIMSENSDSGENALDELYAELESLEKESESTISYVKAASSGIFSSVTDGCEDLGFDDIKALTPSALTGLFSDRELPPDAVGKIITDFNWYYAAIMDESDAGRMKLNLRVDIDFEDSFGQKVPMTVKGISKVEDGKCAVIFTSNKFIADTASLRSLSGKIKFGSVSGIMIPKKALYYDESGSAYVFILAGLQARKAELEILTELEDSVLAVQKDGTSDDAVMLRVGSEIIVRAKGLYDGKVVK